MKESKIYTIKAYFAEPIPGFADDGWSGSMVECWSVEEAKREAAIYLEILRHHYPLPVRYTIEYKTNAGRPVKLEFWL